MNKVSVDLDMNVQGYVQGIDKATQSTADYETETKKVSESQINLMKELKKAKKDVQNLAAGFAKLDKEAKKSAFGQEMARQLNIAKEKAAEYIDMQADLNQELKNMASDTRTLDVLSDAMGVVANSVSTAAGAVATFTGNEEDAKRAVTAFTTATSALATVTKLQNALQKQSSLMLGVQKIQTLAAAQATDAQTAATGKLTIAQKAYNLVAKANPYVILLSAIVAVTAAVGAYVIMTSKAETAQIRLQKAMHEASIEGRKDAQSDIAKLEVLYAATQNVSLSIEEREKAVKKLQDQYPSYFSNMTKEQIMLGEASAKYQQLKDDIIAVAQARAYEKRIATLGEEKVPLEDTLEYNKERLKEINETIAKLEEEGGAYKYGVKQMQTYYNERARLEKQNSTLQKQIDEKTAAQQKYIDKTQQSLGAEQRLEKGVEKTNDAIKNTASATKSNYEAIDKQTNSIDYAINSMADLEKQISTLQDQAKKGILPNGFDSPEQYQKELDRLTSNLKELRIKWGFEKPQTQMQKLQAKVDAAKQALILAIDAKDEQAIQEAQKVYKAAQDELEKYELKIKVALDPALLEKARKEIEELVNSAFDSNKEKYDLSYIPREYEKAANSVLTQYAKLEEAKQKLTEKINTKGVDESVKQQAQQSIDFINGTLSVYDTMLEKYQQMSDDQKEVIEKNRKIAKTASDIGDAVRAAGQMFSALGNVADDTSLKSVGIVAQAVATIALSYANAMNSAGKQDWKTWLVFGLTGLATMLNMISQIKSATAGSYAGGGIVPGNSYSGDRLTANVNSGELILNKRQQQNLFNMLDTGTMPQKGGTNVTVTGVIRGTDLMLVQRNTAKVMKKAGNSINF